VNSHMKISKSKPRLARERVLGFAVMASLPTLSAG
jgi:hypothetical protein